MENEGNADGKLVKLSVLFNDVTIMVIFVMVEFAMDSSQIGSGVSAARNNKVLGIDMNTERNKNSLLARNLSAR